MDSVCPQQPQSVLDSAVCLSVQIGTFALLPGFFHGVSFCLQNLFTLIPPVDICIDSCQRDGAGSESWQKRSDCFYV
jgi:hypothetical protein